MPITFTTEEKNFLKKFYKYGKLSEISLEQKDLLKRSAVREYETIERKADKKLDAIEMVIERAFKKEVKALGEKLGSPFFTHFDRRAQPVIERYYEIIETARDIYLAKKTRAWKDCEAKIAKLDPSLDSSEIFFYMSNLL